MDTTIVARAIMVTMDYQFMNMEGHSFPARALEEVKATRQGTTFALRWVLDMLDDEFEKRFNEEHIAHHKLE